MNHLQSVLEKIASSCSCARRLLWLVPVLFMAGCGAPESETVVRENGEVWPAVVRIAYTPSSEDPEGRLTQYQELSDYLSAQMGVEVSLVRSSSYGPTIEAMRARKIDVATGGSFSYMIAHNKAGAQALISRGNREDGRGIYTSIIATSPSTGITSIEELIALGPDAVLAFTDPASTSGHLVPRSYLESMGAVPEESFRQVVFTQSHLNVMMTTVAGKVHAGAMMRSTYDRFVEMGRIQPDELLILWESAPIPTGPWYVRRDLPEGLKDALATAFVEMPERAPGLMEKFRVQMRRPEMIWIRAEDEMWDGLREIAYNLETMNLLN